MAKSQESMWDEITEAIDKGGYEPSEWEENFMDSIESRARNENLSEKQLDTLEEIHSKVRG